MPRRKRDHEMGPSEKKGKKKTKTDEDGEDEKGEGGKQERADKGARVSEPPCAPARRGRRNRLFPDGPDAVRRVVAFDVGIVNMAYATVTLRGDSEVVIETMCAANILVKDPPEGAPSDEEIIAAASRPRKRGSQATAVAPTSKGKPLKVLTERMIEFLTSRAPRFFAQRPHAVAIELQSKRSIKLSALSAVIHAFVLTYFAARGEAAPPVFIQSGTQKLRVKLVVPPPLPKFDWAKRIGAGRATPAAGAFVVPAAPPRVIPARGRGRKVRTATAAGTDGDASPSSSAGKRKTKDGKRRSKKQEEEAAFRKTYEENKKQARETCATLLDHWPGCRRWKPVFEAAKKKDDMADAVLHALFLLKAGGTSLARDKDLDDARAVTLVAPGYSPPTTTSSSSSSSSSSSAPSDATLSLPPSPPPPCRPSAKMSMTSVALVQRANAIARTDRAISRPRGTDDGKKEDDGVIDLTGLPVTPPGPRARGHGESDSETGTNDPYLISGDEDDHDIVSASADEQEEYTDEDDDDEDDNDGITLSDSSDDQGDEDDDTTEDDDDDDESWAEDLGILPS
jgi:hypothetical protein